MKRALIAAFWFTVAIAALCLVAFGCGGAAGTAASPPVAHVSATGADALPPAWLSAFVATTVAKAGDPHPRLVQWALTTNGALVGRAVPLSPGIGWPQPSASQTPSEDDPKARVYVVAMVGNFTSDGRGHPMSSVMGTGSSSPGRHSLFYIFGYGSHALLRVTAVGGPRQLALTGLAGAHDLTISWSTLAD